MKKMILTGSLLLLAAPALGSALLHGDTAHGEKVHAQYCTSCHDNMTGGRGDMIYTRPNRRISTIEGLIGQVNRCNAMQRLNLSENDLNGITKYLNETFYKFPD